MVETMPRPSSMLNPNAPLFVPMSYLATEDFSPEWWHLIQTSPAFRDFWLRERSAEIMEEEVGAAALDEADDLDLEDFLEMEIHFLQTESLDRKQGNGTVNSVEKEVLAALGDLGVDDVKSHQRTGREPLKYHEKILSKTPRSPRKSCNNQFRIQQPRA